MRFATVPEEIVAWMLAIPEWVPLFDDRVHYGKVPQYVDPDPTAKCAIIQNYVWLQESDAEFDRCLDPNPQRQAEILTYDVELYTLTPTDQQAAKVALQKFDSFQGWLRAENDSLYVNSLFIDNANDDYLFRGLGSDDFLRGGFQVVALQMRVFPFYPTLAAAS